MVDGGAYLGMACVCVACRDDHPGFGQARHHLRRSPLGREGHQRSAAPETRDRAVPAVPGLAVGPVFQFRLPDQDVP